MNILAIVASLPAKTRAVVEAVVDFYASMTVCLLAGGLESLPASPAIQVPLIAMAAMSYALAAALLYAAGSVICRAFKPAAE